MPLYRIAWLLNAKTVGFSFSPAHRIALAEVEKFYNDLDKPDAKFVFPADARPHPVGGPARAFKVDWVEVEEDSAIVRGGREEWPMHVRLSDDLALWAMAAHARMIGHSGITYVKHELGTGSTFTSAAVLGGADRFARDRKTGGAQRSTRPTSPAATRTHAPAPPQPSDG